MRKVTRIEYSKHFSRSLAKTPREVKTKFLEIETVFLKNPFDPKLKTHKLHGKYKDFWSFSVTKSFRIMFAFLGNNTVAFIDIDDHSMYQ